MRRDAKEFLKALYGSVVPPDLRFGPHFREYWRFLSESQYWSYEKLLDYQNMQLSRLVHHAYKYTPYYKRLFDEAGISPDDIKGVGDLYKIPFLTKKEMKDNLEEMRSKAFKEEEVVMGYTGGSTGIPVGFYRDKERYVPIEKAFIRREREWAGFKYRDRLASFAGSVVVQGERRLWYKNPVDNTMDFSSDDLTDENLQMMLQELAKFKPKAIHGYPSAICQVAKYVKDKGVRGVEPSMIFTSSETLYPFQRLFIEEVFGCKVFDRYSHSERAVLATECEKHEGYHVQMEYGILEILDENGKPVDKEGETGEVVATGLHNYAMPIIRFRTDDMARYTSKKCSCKKNYPLVKSFEGRLQELIISREGRKISMTSINFHSDVFHNVRQFQFHQWEKGKVNLQIIKMPDYQKGDSEKIVAEIKKKIGDDIDISLEFVDHIPRTKRGKHTFLVQHLKID